jgi:hypothetical protein
LLRAGLFVDLYAIVRHNAAKAILRFLAGPEAVTVIEAKGMDRVASM